MLSFTHPQGVTSLTGSWPETVLAIATETDTLRVDGIDAVKFLQGQVTCDVESLSSGRVLTGAHCNAKGRAQATFIACPASGGIHLLLPPGMGAPTLEQLRKYAMFSKVTLALVSPPHTLALASGTGVAEALRQCGIDPASETLQGSDTLQAARRDEQHWWILGTESGLLQCLTALPPDTAVTGGTGFRQALFRMGLPHVTPAVQEQFIPQELNYDLTGGISFRKGCYKGQEIIARLHFRGTPKQRTALFAWTGTPPTLGDALLDSDGQKQGSIIDAVAVEGGWWLLATVRTGAAQPLHGLGSETLRPIPLPYAIPEGIP